MHLELSPFPRALALLPVNLLVEDFHQLFKNVYWTWWVEMNAPSSTIVPSSHRIQPGVWERYRRGNFHTSSDWSYHGACLCALNNLCTGSGCSTIVRGRSLHCNVNGKEYWITQVDDGEDRFWSEAKLSWSISEFVSVLADTYMIYRLHKTRPSSRMVCFGEIFVKILCKTFGMPSYAASLQVGYEAMNGSYFSSLASSLSRMWFQSRCYWSSVTQINNICRFILQANASRRQLVRQSLYALMAVSIRLRL